MSFSLSSLLNPEPAGIAEPEQRPDAILPNPSVQSPEQKHATARSGSADAQRRSSHPMVTTEDAAQVLASIASLPASLPTYQYGYSDPEHDNVSARGAFEPRPGSSHGAPIELPPPTATARNPGSPTLEAYSVTSRSPEQRRSSVISPIQSTFTLPPIQGFTSPHQDPAVSVPVHRSSQSAVESTAETKSKEVETTTAVKASQGDASGKRDQDSFASELKHTTATPATTSATQSSSNDPGPAPTHVKQEHISLSQPTSSLEKWQMESTHKAVASLKQDHNIRTQSPLRESSVPIPSTESAPASDVAPSKKRPAPARSKKGTATTTKKAPPAKKRKLDVPRSETPASRTSRAPTLKAASSRATPANSSAAGSTRSNSAEADDEPYDDDADVDEDVEGNGTLYCLCRKPDNGTFMIGCDGPCEDWFHGKCVGVEERDKDLVDKYICPNCTKAGAGKTAWKRVCRRSGCRKPARVGKNKTGKDVSKYCSEECGVLYFREMVSRTRNREDSQRHRSSRRKSSIVGVEKDDDIGAKGGLLSAGEVKSMINASKSAEDFKKLGEGVLSPPATPDGKDTTTEATYTDAETAALERIHKSKEEARRRHQLLKDRMKFVTMVKQAASRTATEKELKPKEYCGYDPRIEWTEEQFAAWRESKAGQQAFELETLAVENSGNEHTDYGSKDPENAAADDESVYAQMAICDRKKCARHLEWGKLAVDDIRFEMGDNSDNMRALDSEEKEIRERVALRAKMGAGVNGEGEVEVHELGITNGQGSEDVEMGGMSGVPPPPPAPEVPMYLGQAMVVDAAA